MKRERRHDPVIMSLDGLDNMAESLVDDSKKHPTPEQLFIRQAVKYLTPKQKQAWEYYNYDRLTMDEIAKKLKVSEPAIVQRIQGAEKRITRYCRDNMGAYNLIKGEMKDE